MTTKNLLAVSLCTSMAVIASQTTQAATWTGGGDGTSFEDDANWNPNPPDATRNINTAVTVTRDVDINVNRTFVEGGAVLNVTAGTHSDGQSGASIYNFVGNNSLGTVNQSGGSYDIGHALRIGGGNANSDGTYNLSGGSLNLSRGANSNLQSGTDRPSLQVGSPTAGAQGLFEISGGSLITRFGSHIGGGGVFSVVGSGASSISFGNNANGDGHWVQRSGSTLKAAIDAGGLTKIFIDDNNDDGLNVFAEFEAGSLLDLSFNGIAPVAGTWTVLELENNDIEISGTGTVTGNSLGLALTGSTDANWSFAVDNSGANGLLIATYVPEPGSLALLGLGGLLIARRRRNA